MATKTAGHPRGLYILFFTEMWERFSYYGMRALLVPYMVSAAFGYQPKEASGVYKWYTSLVYLAPLAGGLVADRFLGLRNAVLIGAVLMAIGHFLMAFPSHTLFFLALGFLIFGNGFFKPNISTMVGKMYTPDDERRDRAFTIFYMGINIGAFLSSIVCPLLQEKVGFHYGFGAAGIGMLVGLLVFAFGQKRVVADVEAVGNTTGTARDKKAKEAEPKEGETGYRESAKEEPEQGDAEKPGATGIAALVGKVYPFVMLGAGPTIVTVYVLKVLRGEAKPIVLIMPIAFGAIFIAMGLLLMRLRGAQKDKSVSIFIMFLFPVLFWMAFEQAGNALNLWAVDHTDRVLGGWEYPAGWWQSANALMIFVLAPLFALMWSALAKRGKEPSTPGKMFFAMVMMVVSFVVMVVGSASESATESRVPLAKAPAVDLSTMAAGRLGYDASKHELTMRGVMPDFAARDVIEKTSDPKVLEGLKAFGDASDKATASAPVDKELEVERFVFTTEASELKELGLAAAVTTGPTTTWKGEKLSITLTAPEGQKPKLALHATAGLEAQAKTAILEAALEPEWKKALRDLEKASRKARVSGTWLFLSYLFATLGELCLSPVGLSMVTKLAPARFASLFMGVWLLSSSVAQYVGGSIGESWGQIAPSAYFTIFVGTSIGGIVLVLLFMQPLKKLMHEVK
jgi:POT family proton-dependent oligopeptide transporter